MIQIDDTIIRNLIFHRISAKEKSSLSDIQYEYQSDEEAEILKKIFLKPFLSVASTHEFKHEIDLELNPLFKLSQSILEDQNFISQSKKICHHLISVSKHPNIKDGDLFLLKYDDVMFDGKFFEALGIYKIENKESFIETSEYNGDLSGLNFKKGIGTKRLDKACLIIFTKQPYTILVIDNATTETDYWQNEFIKLNLKKDNINNTGQFLSLARSFVTKQLPNDFEVSKADQIDLLNRSVGYFKTHESFDKGEFENEVFKDDEIKKSFRNYDSIYRQEHELIIEDNFNISSQAVKKQARVFKSVLKLDKNFHIYIHGNRELIEQGVDNDGRKFYKIYYNEEH
jgi:hypothetical protein